MCFTYHLTLRPLHGLWNVRVSLGYVAKICGSVWLTNNHCATASSPLCHPVRASLVEAYYSDCSDVKEEAAQLSSLR